ncbi:MAG: hypothetical protein RLZZ540_624 [Bacteroidota bacterium]
MFGIFYFLMSCGLSCKISIKKPQQMLGFRDLDWIQTSNLLSRNQVRYSVAPQGHFAVVL